MARDHRRLAAVVSADVVGYCLLMGRDDSATLARIKAHRRELIDPRIAEFGGRIVKTTGDGLLLEFPSVVDAVLCAVDVQRGMVERNAGQFREQRIDFRIGINVGDIIIDGDDIFGDGVNVAARLQTLAEPGGICVSRVVRDQVLDKLGFTFEGLGSREVKNIAHRVEVYRVDHGAAPLQSRSWFRKRWQQVKKIPSQRWLPVGLSVLGLAGLVAWTVPRSWILAPAPTPPTLSVAILPFAPPSDNPADVQFAEAFTNLCSTLAGFANCRGKFCLHKGKSIDARAVGRDLNVRYVVEGDVRRASSGIVVSTQLIATGDAT
jgi:adenylate cyclase